MQWSELVKRLMEEYGEKWNRATRITDWLDTAIDDMEKAIDAYMDEEYQYGNSMLAKAEHDLKNFKDWMNRIDPELAEYFYTVFMTTIREIELARDNNDVLWQISEFKIPALLQMTAQLFAVLLLYY